MSLANEIILQSLVPLSGCLLLMVTSANSRLWGEEPPRDFAGKYKCKGQDVNGREYQGIVEITQQGDSYTLNWAMPGGQVFIGVGIPNGKMLSVSWANRVAAGVMVYKLQDDGRLIGRWALINSQGTVQKETLTPIE